MIRLKNLVVILLVCGLPGLALADLRCGNELVQVGDDFSEVIDTCGEPYATYDLGTRYVSLNDRYGTYGGGEYSEAEMEYTEAVHTEMWIYKPGQGKLKRILYFENGLLTRVKYGDRT